MNTMQSSELILNPDGSIYHLALKKENVAKKIIIVGDPNRVPMVSKHFDSISFKMQKREFVTHTGSYEGKDLSVISTGIGCDNIDIVLNELDAIFNIDLEKKQIKEEKTSLEIVRIGTCGSLQKDMDVDQFIASTHGLGIDNLLHFYPNHNNEKEKNLINAFLDQTNWPQHILPYIYEGNKELLDRIGFDMHQAITTTAGGFYGPQGRNLRANLAINDINEKLQDFLYDGHRIGNFEMETSALFGLGRILGHKCATFCNIIANREQQTFSKDPYQSIEKLIKVVLDRI